MSDAPQGPGWWQASDGRWYPPQEPPPTEPVPETQPIPPVPPAPPTQSFGPIPPAPPPDGGGGGNRLPVVIGIAILVIAAGVAAFLLTRNDGDNGSADQTDQTESTDQTDNTDQTDAVNLDSLLLAAGDLGKGFREIDDPAPRKDTLCGTPSFRDTTHPTQDAGVAAQNADGTVTALEELFLYGSEAEAKDAYNTAVKAVDCNKGTLGDGTQVKIDGFDATNRVKADEAWGIELTGTDVVVDGMVARVGNILVVMQGINDTSATASSGGTKIDFEGVAKKAVKKVRNG